MRAVSRALIVFVLILGLSSCTDKKAESKKEALTDRQRDSVLAETPLPGAHVVGRAIEVADSAAARAERLDGRND